MRSQLILAIATILASSFSAIGGAEAAGCGDCSRFLSSMVELSGDRFHGDDAKSADASLCENLGDEFSGACAKYVSSRGSLAGVDVLVATNPVGMCAHLGDVSDCPENHIRDDSLLETESGTEVFDDDDAAEDDDNDEDEVNGDNESDDNDDEDDDDDDEDDDDDDNEDEDDEDEDNRAVASRDSSNADGDAAAFLGDGDDDSLDGEKTKKKKTTKKTIKKKRVTRRRTRKVTRRRATRRRRRRTRKKTSSKKKKRKRSRCNSACRRRKARRARAAAKRAAKREARLNREHEKKLKEARKLGMLMTAMSAMNSPILQAGSNQGFDDAMSEMDDVGEPGSAGNSPQAMMDKLTNNGQGIMTSAMVPLMMAEGGHDNMQMALGF